MRRPRWARWDIAARLVTIALVPAMLMFIAISGIFYVTSQDEVLDDLRERGMVLTAALAESAQYGVVSGNVGDLDRTLKGLLSADRSILAIQIFDTNKQPITVAGDADQPPDNALAFERPIYAQVLDVDLFDNAARPHVAERSATRPASRQGNVVGHVRVLMSPDPSLEAKRRRIYIGMGVLLLATILSGFAGVFLAQRLSRPLRSVLDSIRQIRRGNYDVRFEPARSAELRELETAVVDMARTLSATRQDLENQVSERTRELQEAIAKALDADAERRRLIAQGNALVEDERQRIAVEIHDHLNASLIVVQFEAQRLAEVAATLPESEQREEFKRIADQISRTTAELYASARTIVKQLRPEVIDTLGLKGAIEEMVRNYDKVQAECRFTLRAEAGFPNLRGELAITAYRVVQEALSNVVKHSAATRARVTLGPGSEKGHVRITISDNGKGFDVKKRSAGVGLIGVRERVDAAGGTFDLASTPGAGTKLTIELPLTRPDMPSA